MKSYGEMDFHPLNEGLAKILMEQAGQTDPLFFRIMASYYFSIVASMMRCRIDTLDRGTIPVNMYAINLATSGFGKGHSTNTLEEVVISQFQHNFIEHTLPRLAEINLPKIAHQRAARKGTDLDNELELTIAEYDRMGPLLFSFDSATTPAIKDIRHKLLLAEAGSINLQIDEIGNNLSGNMDAMATFLELYDVGRLKQKLIKNTADSKRNEEIQGRTPANMLLFGTPNRLLNGGKTEEEFYDLLDTGYARRCFFGYCRRNARTMGRTAAEVLAQRTQKTNEQFLEDLADKLGDLADQAFAHKRLQVSEAVTLLFIEYQLACEAKAEEMPDHEEMRKSELSHRYFKAMKLAGTYAFIDQSPEITEDHAYNAIKLAECSGEAFDNLLTRDRPYAKLAKYVADIKRPVTQADLVEDLPFYKGSASQKGEMMQLAIAYGYQNNILIKKQFTDGIEFIHGESMESTDLSEIRVSYSTDIAHNYLNETADFSDLHVLTQKDGMHWASHHFNDGHRCEDKAIPGFNLVVLDVENSVTLDTARNLLTDYKALFYTTRRHTDDDHRFRIVLPTNYFVKLDGKDYKDFMASLFEWLPFVVDEATGQRARKWLSHNGQYVYQDGQLLDILPFIPKTSKNEEHKQRILDQAGMDNLERWVINNTGDGNRNNMLLRYALLLVDASLDFESIRQRVNSLNNKMADPIPEAEIMGTVMVTVSKSIALKAAA